MNPSPSPIRLILWPSLLTLAISIARLVAEVQGWLTTASGGRFLPLGITWCVFVFGAWFGWRLSRAGAGPRLRRPWAWALVALLATIGTAAFLFRPLVEADQSDATMERVRHAVLVVAAVTATGALLMFVVWPRLAWTLLLYAVPARGTVVALTWLAKHQGWDTHYSKFGPSGIERDMAGTIESASFAQFGFWVPFTILGGVLAGGLFVRRGPGAAGAHS